MSRSSSCPLEALPPNAFQQILLYLPDPGPLAAICSAVASQLDQQALQLAWAEAWAARLTGDSSEHRHPGYVLLHWRRLHCRDTGRLVAMLLCWMERSQAPAATRSIQRTQQLLDSGDALAALHALLPHSEHLLLQYAAQAGHTRLLGELLAQPGAAEPVELRWDTTTHVDCCLLLPAAFAAVRSGQEDALHMLLAAVAASNECPTAEDLGNMHFSLLCAAIKGGSRSVCCVVPLLQLCQGPQWKQLIQYHTLPTFTHTANNAVINAVLTAVAACSPDAAYKLALRSGQVQLLPRLRPDTMSDLAAAVFAVVEAAKNLLCSGEAAQLQHLAQAMLRLASDDTSSSSWRLRDIVQQALSLNSIAALDSMWAAFAAGVATEMQRAVLACSMLHALQSEAHRGDVQHATVQWVAANALPVVNSLPADRARMEAVEAAALGCLRAGRSEWLVMFQAPETTAALVSEQFAWPEMQLIGHVHAAGRRGDAAAARTALEALQAHLAIAAQFTMGQIGVVGQALGIAAQLPDAAAAEAVVRAVAPFIDGAHSRQAACQPTSQRVPAAHGAP